MIENRGKSDDQETRGSSKNSLDDANNKSIKEQSDICAQHLKSYLRFCTDGELHARVIQTDFDEVMELIAIGTPIVSSTSKAKVVRLPRRTRRATSTRFSRNGDTHET